LSFSDALATSRNQGLLTKNLCFHALAGKKLKHRASREIFLKNPVAASKSGSEIGRSCGRSGFEMAKASHRGAPVDRQVQQPNRGVLLQILWAIVGLGDRGCKRMN
jgi:hypothetical protein